MGAVVVQDDVKVLAGMGGGLLQEPQELLVAVAGSRRPRWSSRWPLPGRRTAWRCRAGRSHESGGRPSLDLPFLSDADHRVVQRRQVQADHVADLRLQFRVAGLPSRDPVAPAGER